MKPSRYIENIQLVVQEASAFDQSLANRMARREIALVHRDLPEVLTNIAVITSLVAEHHLERLSLSYAEAAMREIIATGKRRLTTLDKIHAINNASKAVIVQEAAAQILCERYYDQAPQAFQKPNQVYEMPASNPGMMALGAMKKMGIDMKTLCSDMNNADLKAIAMGRFHRVSLANADRVISLLRVPGNEIYTIAHGPKVEGNDYGPVVNPSQTQKRVRPSPLTKASHQPRKVSFSARMAEKHKAHAET